MARKYTPAQFLTMAVVGLVAFVYAFGSISGWYYIVTGQELVAGATTPGGTAIGKAMLANGYVYHLLKFVELLGAILLIFRQTRPLGIVMLAGPTVAIFVLHLTDTQGFLMGTGLMLGLLFLAWTERRRLGVLWR
jgi:hypothetical protein